MAEIPRQRSVISILKVLDSGYLVALRSYPPNQRPVEWQDDMDSQLRARRLPPTSSCHLVNAVESMFRDEKAMDDEVREIQRHLDERSEEFLFLVEDFILKFSNLDSDEIRFRPGNIRLDPHIASSVNNNIALIRVAMIVAAAGVHDSLLRLHLAPGRDGTAERNRASADLQTSLDRLTSGNKMIAGMQFGQTQQSKPLTYRTGFHVFRDETIIMLEFPANRDSPWWSIPALESHSQAFIQEVEEHSHVDNQGDLHAAEGGVVRVNTAPISRASSSSNSEPAPLHYRGEQTRRQSQQPAERYQQSPTSQPFPSGSTAFNPPSQPQPSLPTNDSG
ncbi:hypothetical protein SCHPADRAFT_897549, partial [Schizopora paradoxa]